LKWSNLEPNKTKGTEPTANGHDLEL
jgi:hypothetical protein